MMLELVIGVFVWLVGLCVGSFLNVVVYRLPRDLSINQPSRSFCPLCGAGIAWYDNIPVVSWLALRAKCRKCGAGISVQYPLIEAATGVAFVLVYYLLYVADARAGVDVLVHPADWPLLLAWLVLVAAMTACAAMDLVSYMVDVRITYAAMIAGVVLYAAWPRADFLVPRATTPVAGGAVVTLLVSVVWLWFTEWRIPEEPAPEPDEAAEPESGTAPLSRAATAGGCTAVVAFVGLAVWLLVETAGGGRTAGGSVAHLVVPLTLVGLFALMVLAGGQPRTADDEVSDAIEEEQPHARWTALRELLWLAVPIVAGALAYGAVAYVPAIASGWETVARWSPGGGFCPAGGVTYAAVGMIIGAAAGWALRIVFTLIFGREALGVGDIYILAAAGAAAGWDIALLGLLFAVGFAITGYVCSLVLKRTLIIPFGPWLALGFVAALWQSRAATTLAWDYYDDVMFTWSRQPDVCFIAGGLMLVGTAVAVVMARLVRRAVEPAEK